jgi:hypothetical protein
VLFGFRLRGVRPSSDTNQHPSIWPPKVLPRGEAFRDWSLALLAFLFSPTLRMAFLSRTTSRNSFLFIFYFYFYFIDYFFSLLVRVFVYDVAKGKEGEQQDLLKKVNTLGIISSTNILPPSCAL